MLSAKNISYHIGKTSILQNVSADFLPGEFAMILGPNGSGKSTFLKIFSGEINKFEGAVYYSGSNIHSIKKETLATYRAVMSQQPELSFPLTVEEVVMMGRYPHFTFSPVKKDIEICREALALMHLCDFKERNYTTLSGGEKQRVQYARVLAQIWEPPVSGLRYLFLDEPLNNLDIKYQQNFLKTACSFKNSQTVLVAVMHDINLATQYADKLIFFKQGKIRAQGTPQTVITEALVKEIFEVDVTVVKSPGTETPLLLFK
jgi:iron complex transport system ATP-binding protein